MTLTIITGLDLKGGLLGDQQMGEGKRRVLGDEED